MKISTILACSALIAGSFTANAQPFYVSLSTGIAGYSGDLQAYLYNPHNVHLAFGANIKYNFNTRMSLRLGYNYGFLSASDVNNNWDLRFRNLSFATNIHEGNIIIETDILSPENNRLVPYIMTGIGMYHFNPFYRDINSKKVFLHQLGTEGQNMGLTSPYKLTQGNLIGGGGIKFMLNETITLTYEIGFRKLFTDYIDDVSTTYKLPPGSSYVSFAFKEIGTAYASRHGRTRGGSTRDDLYYFSTLGVSIGIGDILQRITGIESMRSPTRF
jgi:hypothetical protein